MQQSIMVTLNHKLIVAISSTALFNLEESNQIYEQQGLVKYSRYQIQHENEILLPGSAFSLVQKFLNLNNDNNLVEVILLSRNSADTGLRVFNSIAHYDLKITRAVFTGGKSPYRYAQAFGSHLFLSTNPTDVRHALNAGCAAATILPNALHQPIPVNQELRIAFDGDAVLFSDEAERIFQSHGVEAFATNEKNAANQPLPQGPFAGFLQALHALQAHFNGQICPIRTALITARQAPAHERVIKTLRAWDIRIDEAAFLGGLDKGNFLHAFGADIFFDDQQKHCQSALQYTTAGHVPSGIINQA